MSGPSPVAGGRPRVVVLSMGGTIASVPSGALGVSPGLEGSDLVAAVPQLNTVADVDTQSVMQVPGAHLTVEDLLALASVVNKAHDAGANGVVVTQGTDTIEDTAFLLDLLVPGPAPVVVTGAMRNPTLPGADGPANLLAAVTVAADPAARGLGALVVLNDEIHAARFVHKQHASNPGAFRSHPGAIGWVAEGRSHVALRPIGRLHLPHPAPDARQRVATVTLAAGDDGMLIAAADAAGVDGLIVEALGGGHVPPKVVDLLAAAARRVPVVVTSTTRAGDVLRSTYDFPGSEFDLAACGVLNGGHLEARKAGLLLTLLLLIGADRSQIAATFADPWGDNGTFGG